MSPDFNRLLSLLEDLICVSKAIYNNLLPKNESRSVLASQRKWFPEESENSSFQIILAIRRLRPFKLIGMAKKRSLRL